MENFTYVSCNVNEWQASSPCMLLNFKDQLLTARQEPRIIPQTEPKKLTEEAVCMILVLLLFVGLSALGSSITIYEYFFKDNEKKSYTLQERNNGKVTNTRKSTIKEKKRTEIHDFWEYCKLFLKCFCMVTNGRTILSTTSSESQIDCFHGLRFLSNLLVISLHTGFTLLAILRNLDDFKPFLHWRLTYFVLNIELFAVDIFFVISGFLNAKAFFYKYRSSDGKIPWFHFFFKRFVRLTPVHMIVLGFHTTLFTYMGTGSLWPTYDTNPICQRDWWWYLLYINNFKESAKQCLPWCWSLAADMQFYLISPLFMVSLIRWPRLGYSLIFAFISGSCIISFVSTYQFNLIDGLSQLEFQLDDLKTLLNKLWEYFDLVYQKPYTRISPYLIAILLAYYLHKKSLKKETRKKSKMTLTFGWIITVIFMWICFFSLYKSKDLLIVKALYNGTKHLFFSCGLVWIIYLCLTGQSEFLNNFLSWKFFHPLSRLSYCAFLIHLFFLSRVCLQSQDFMDFSFISVVWLLMYIFGCTYVVSFFVSMLFEMPVLNLLDFFAENKTRKNTSLTHLD